MVNATALTTLLKLAYGLDAAPGVLLDGLPVDSEEAGCQGQAIPFDT